MTKTQKFFAWAFIVINATAASYFTVTNIGPVISYEYQEHISGQ